MASKALRDSESADRSSQKLTTTSTVSAGFNRKTTNLHDIQLHPATLGEFPNVSEGEFLKITADHDERSLEFYGRVEALDDRFDTEIKPDEIGVGIHCRRGIAVSIGDEVLVEEVDLDTIGFRQRMMNSMLRFRPASCRVRKASSPDAGYRVCRIPPEVKDLVGIEWGDRIVIQSANARLRGMKALPLHERLEEKYRGREEEAPTRYPPPFVDTDEASRAGLLLDLPRIYISASARNELQLRGDGVYQPVKVHRDTSDVFVRLFDKLSIPIVLGAATIIIGFDISMRLKIIVFIVALIVALFSIRLHARRVLLE